MTIRLLVFTLLAALLPLRAFPQNTAKASIEGTVQTAAGKGLRASRITLNKVDTGGSGTQTNVPSPVSDDKGHFRIDGLEAGSYRVAAESFGYIRQEYGEKNSGGRGILISLQSGQTMTTNFQMVPASVISGRVRDVQGEPVAGAMVQLMAYQYIFGRRVLMPTVSYSSTVYPSALSAFTNDLGEYRMFWIALGEYYVSVTGRAELPGSALVDASPKRAVERPFLGGVTDHPLPETFAIIYYPDVADAASAAPVKVAASAEVKGIDLTWRPIRLPAIRGQVVLSGAPPAAPALGPSSPRPGGRVVQSQSSSLFLTRLDGPRMQVSGQGGRSEMNGVAGGAAEIFEIRGVAPGSYYINEEMRQNGTAYFGKTRVDVGDSDVNDVTVTVQPVLNVQGKVIFRSPAPASLRMDQLSIEISPIDTSGLRSGGVRVAEDGSFLLSEIAPVRYKLSVARLPAEGYIASATVGATDVMTGPFVVSDSSDTLRLEIGLSVGQITGTVFDSRNNGSSSSVVALIPDEPLRDRLDLYFTTSSDPAGRFVFSNVPAGSYRVFAWDQIPDGAHQSAEFMRRFEDRGTSVRVDGGGSKEVRVPLIQE